MSQVTQITKEQMSSLNRYPTGPVFHTFSQSLRCLGLSLFIRKNVPMGSVGKHCQSLKQLGPFSLIVPLPANFSLDLSCKPLPCLRTVGLYLVFVQQTTVVLMAGKLNSFGSCSVFRFKEGGMCLLQWTIHSEMIQVKTGVPRRGCPTWNYTCSRHGANLTCGSQMGLHKFLSAGDLTCDCHPLAKGNKNSFLEGRERKTIYMSPSGHLERCHSIALAICLSSATGSVYLLRGLICSYFQHYFAFLF